MSGRDYMICRVIEVSKLGEGDIIADDSGAPLQITDHQIGGLVEFAVNTSRSRVYIKFDLADAVRLVMNQAQAKAES
jgi:hypothetical protein